VKKTTIVNLVLAVFCVALVSGCAGMGKGPSDEELAMQTATAFSQALTAKNHEGVMATISEDFNDDEAGDKAGLGDYIQGAIDAGYFENGECDMANAQVTIEGDTATVYPIVLSSSMGSITIGVKMKKEKEGFMVVGLDVET
jgi:hypothetical protein